MHTPQVRPAHLIVLLLVSSAFTASGKVIEVPTDQPTIQAALDSAVSGDEIVVLPDEYFENILIDEKDIMLRSLDPSDEQIVHSTIINGGGNGPVVTFSGFETVACIVEGFTITNGNANEGGGACLVMEHTLPCARIGLLQTPQLEPKARFIGLME